MNPFASWYQPSAGSVNGSSATKTVEQRLANIETVEPRLAIIEAALKALAEKTPVGAAVVTREGQEPTRAAKEPLHKVVMQRGGAGADERLGSSASSRIAPLKLPSTVIRAAEEKLRQSMEGMVAAGEALDVAHALDASLKENLLECQNVVGFLNAKIDSARAWVPLSAADKATAAGRLANRVRAKRSIQGDLDAEMRRACREQQCVESALRHAEVRVVDLEQDYAGAREASEKAAAELEMVQERERCNEGSVSIQFGDLDNDANGQVLTEHAHRADPPSIKEKAKTETVVARANAVTLAEQGGVRTSTWVGAEGGCLKVVAEDGETGFNDAGEQIGPDAQVLRRESPLSDQDLLERKKASILLPRVISGDGMIRAMRLGVTAVGARRLPDASMIVDSGATKIMLPMEIAEEAQLVALGSVRVRDAQGNFFAAESTGPASAWLRDKHGKWVRERVAESALFGKAVAEPLFSIPGIKVLGWGLTSNLGLDGYTYITSPAGNEFPLTVGADGHFYLEAHFGTACPMERSVSFASVGTPRAAVAVEKSMPKKKVHWQQMSKGERWRRLETTSESVPAAAARAREAAAAEAAAMAAATVARQATMEKLQQMIPPAPVSTSPLTPDSVKEGRSAKEKEKRARAKRTKRLKIDGKPRAAVGAEPLHWRPTLSSVLEEANVTTPAPIGEAELLDDDAARRQEVLDKAWAEKKIEQCHESYLQLHCAWNCSETDVDAAIRDKILDPAAIRKPDNFHCPYCGVKWSKGASFCQTTDTLRYSDTPPFHSVEMDIWGPFDCGDRNGFRYMLGLIDRSTGYLFLHPMRKKSEAAEIYKKFKGQINAWAPLIEAKTGYLINGIAELFTDRGGEFTTTFGATRSVFDELVMDIKHSLNTPDTPKSGTTKIERVWGILPAASRSAVYSSGLAHKYFWDAFVRAGDVYNMLLTEANRLGKGEAPKETLGLPYDLQMISVGFGSDGYLQIPGAKRDDKAELVVVLGLNHDGPGFRVLKQDGTIVASVHVRAVTGGKVLRTALAEARKDPATASAFMKEHYNLGDDVLGLQAAKGGCTDLDIELPGAVALVPPVQVVGATPGMAGSRVSLHPRALTKNEKRAGQRHPVPAATRPARRGTLSLEVANAMITSAAAAGHVFKWADGHKKSGLSGERYRIYSKCQTFAAYTKLKTQPFTTANGQIKGTVVLPGDMPFDVQRGILTFVGCADPIYAGPTPSIPTTLDSATSVLPVLDSDVLNVFPEDLGDASDNVVADRTRGKQRRLVRAATAYYGDGLTREQRELFQEGVRAQSAYIDVPDIIMMAAVVSNGIVLPRSMAEAQSSPQWPQWKAALEKELGGLRQEGVYSEVDRRDVPAGVTPIPTQILWTVKLTGEFKVRLVVRGDKEVQGVHFLQSKSSMATQEGVRITVALAASTGYALYSTDFSQAFVNAPETNLHKYVYLPDLPGELGFGSGKGRIGHMHRCLYGQKDAGRQWSQYLLRYLVDDLGARVLTADRNCFKWEWQGHKLHGAIHVDDILFAVSSSLIRDEFMRRLKERFRVTGGEDEVTDFCGLQIRRDYEAKTVTLHQERYARQMMQSYGMEMAKTEKTPFMVSAAVLHPYDGIPLDEVETFDYSQFLGDLAWYSRTNPGLAWPVHELARFMANPGPEHIAAARHVLGYIKGHLSAGLTYHGSNRVLQQSYDHRDKMVAMFDANFPHDGAKATSGVAVLFNGAAISWKVRRQTTVSLNTTEAEVKAISMGVEMVKSLHQLVSEFMGVEHASVRAMVDSQAAEMQIVDGLDTKKCASYKRSQAYAENAVERGLLWLDHVPGKENPADVLTKAVRCSSEFQKKCAVLSGEVPFLFESTAVLGILAGEHTVR